MERQNKPRVMILSSSEKLSVAYAIQENLDKDAEITVWEHAFTELSKGILETIVDSARDNDYAIFVLADDDISFLRGEKFKTTRDNVILELGIFIGTLGIRSCFMIVPRGIQDHHLPTDLAGLTYATYNNDRSDNNVRAALSPACNKVRKNLFRPIKDISNLKSFDSFQNTKIDWEEMFANCHEVDLLFMGSATWRNYHFDRIENFLSKENSQIRVILPDPNSNYTMKAVGKMLSKA
ncbi:Predicted nucleotide-binding protein containing TIR-like domain-containing protein [Fodinibius roseus]|uniref:Predicted nucleotide-binding protein containing TIR-like domain-containing protein n=1 Tax=Fodinibius roseus TaxID=1194090 RepID=A0A1M5LKV4_9BACT|nr:TIR domain-containing protein [Fodinibius roseus]SHG64993.1 Predicted nucleotide-binding protein containing TIR-like domain-containing protein [Fodinibius roseus]